MQMLLGWAAEAGPGVRWAPPQQQQGPRGDREAWGSEAPEPVYL